MNVFFVSLNKILFYVKMMKLFYIILNIIVKFLIVIYLYVDALISYWWNYA